MYKKATIINRPNRFIANVKLDGNDVICHVPATGSIGGYVLDGLPCLLSGPHESPTRKTKYTLEAIAFPTPTGNEWVGINQTAINGIVANLLTDNVMAPLGLHGEIRREVKLGKSRMDFKVGNTWVEVKLPLKELSAPITLTSNNKSIVSADRMIKQLGDIMTAMDSGEQAIMLIVFMYDAPLFAPVSDGSSTANEITNVVNAAQGKGMTYWQLNLAIDEKGVTFRKLIKLDMK